MGGWPRQPHTNIRVSCAIGHGCGGEVATAPLDSFFFSSFLTLPLAKSAYSFYSLLFFMCLWVVLSVNVIIWCDVGRRKEATIKPQCSSRVSRYPPLLILFSSYLGLLCF